MKRLEMIGRLKAGESPIDVSIRKWKDVLSGNDENKGLSAGNCALCFVYQNTNYLDCLKCPIKILTGASLCKHTPYKKLSHEIKEGERNEDKILSYQIQMHEFLIKIKKQMEGKK